MKKKSLYGFISIVFLMISCRGGDFSKGEKIPAYSEYTKKAGVDYLEIIAYGDAGRGNVTQQATAEEMRKYASDPDHNIEFIINLGDSFYNSGVDSVTDTQWESSFESIYDPSVLNMPFYSVLGNHEARGSVDALLEYVSYNNDRWQMPSLYYSVSKILPDGTKIDFYFLDTENLFYGDADQISWLEESLEQSDAQWIIVAAHRPLFSYGSHGFNGDLITRLQPLLNDKVDIYIAGHDHDLQILGPLNGVYYIVDGSASSLRETGIGELTEFAAEKNGFMAFLISKNDLVCNVLEEGKGIIYSRVLKQKD